MTYYVQPRQSNKGFVIAQVITIVLALFFLFGWVQERDAREQEAYELEKTLAALDSECGPVMDMSWPVEVEIES